MTQAMPLDASEQAARWRFEKLFAAVLVTIGVTTTATGIFDSGDGLFTAWDDWMVPATSLCYLVSGVLIFLRPRWAMPAVWLSVLPTMIYQQGVMFVAVHQPSLASYYSASSSGPWFPLIYVVMFIVMTRGAALGGWIHCAGFVLQFLLNVTVLAGAPSPERLQAEHALAAVMLSHPVYVLALSYIVGLRERLYQTHQEAFKQKEDFLAMLSHEIRNLMQTMVNAIDLLSLKMKDPVAQRTLDRLHTVAGQLQTYLVDVNELTKLEDPALRLATARFDLIPLLKDIRDEWEAQAAAQGLVFELHGVDAAHDLIVETDALRLRQILVNLVSNAVKYTVRGSVVLALERDDDEIRLAVVDTGIGMDAQQVDRIFQPYVRLQNAKEIRVAGSGLGLAIVARLAASLGIRLKVTSTLGEGSSFQVMIPRQVQTGVGLAP